MELTYYEQMTQEEIKERKSILDDYYKTDFKVALDKDCIIFEDGC